MPEDDVRETEHQREHLHESGGMRYQRAHRAAGAAHDDASKATAGARSEIARETAAPAQDQTADQHGGPGPDDEAWLAGQGYPKLDKQMQSQLTQVEHGPYAGGTQQGDANNSSEVERRQ